MRVYELAKVDLVSSLLYHNLVLSKGAILYGTYRDIIMAFDSSCPAGAIASLPWSQGSFIGSKLVSRTVTGQEAEIHLDNIAIWPNGEKFVKSVGEILNGRLVVDICWKEEPSHTVTGDPLEQLTPPAAIVTWQPHKIRSEAGVIIPSQASKNPEPHYIHY